ncbi:MAG: endonuclease domain-containing protein [Candidatus Portnoybacteria bacterium]|nr:endonuclease domain-containing protein [Candidatus Portnoybacteria bacterium]
MPLRYVSYLKSKSRDLRSRLTDAEKLLWSKIRKRQIKDCLFNRQKPIDNYIVDFYCDRAKLVIEIDGGQHYETKNIVADRKRDLYLKNLGLRILRFTNLDVLRNIDNVVEKIRNEI